MHAINIKYLKILWNASLCYKNTIVLCKQQQKPLPARCTGHMDQKDTMRSFT